jgi:outer membrane protein assembly factor BamB
MSRRAIVLLASALLSACSWFGGDDKVVIASLVDLPEQPVVLHDLWSRGVGDQGAAELWLMLTPALAGEAIYAANVDGHVTAMDRNNGKVLWTQALDVSLMSAVGASDKLVLVADRDGAVYALNTADGEQVWRGQATSEVLAAPTTDGDVVIVQSTDSRVRAFDALTGAIRWTYSAPQALLTLRGTAAPVIRDGVVYVAFNTGKAAALDARTGQLRWEQHFIVPEGRSELERVIDVHAEPLLVGPYVFIGSFQGAVVSLNRESGRPEWSEKASTLRSMAEGEGNLYVVENDDTVRALSLVSGREVWKSALFSGRQLTAPAVLGEYVAVADFEGYIHLLKQSDGSYVGRYNVGGDGVRMKLQSEGDSLYVLTNSGKLWALSVKKEDAKPSIWPSIFQWGK